MESTELTVLDRITVKVVGRGPDVVFIPGLSASRDTWIACASGLQDRYRLHLIQVAGFAGEPARANGQGDVLIPTIETIKSYLLAKNLAPATLVGHSLGGTMILYLAEHAPDCVRKALIIDVQPYFGTLMGGPGATPDTMKPMADAIRARTQPASASEHEKIMAAMVTSPEHRERLEGWRRDSDPSVVARATADDLMLDLRPALGGIQAPMTLVYPDYSPRGVPAGVMDQSYRAAYAAVPHINFVAITNSLHFVMLDQPEQFVHALQSFLDDSNR